MTVEQLKELAEDPKKFLNRCRHHEQRIKMKKDQIQHYRDMEYSITAAIKDIPSFGNKPTSKIENCSISIMAIEEDIQNEILEIQKDRALIRKAINLVDDEDLRQLLEARYLNELKWEEIALLLNHSYRWTLRLHGKALKNISQKAKEAILSHA
ncbi:MAG: hypothetical protein Q4D26_07615 [Clostridia bacterium]|nr:hypothetical protein [Clostridia bacterium]